MAGSLGVPVHRAAVLGQPIRHSLSPVIHNAGYAAAGLIGWRYDAHEVDAPDLAGFVAGLGPEWAGLSLTMPLKEVALGVADEVSTLASVLGAANTLVRLPDLSWRADNTDAPGMVSALRAGGLRAGAPRVAVLGAGGTARAALAAARDLGADVVTVFARRPDAVDALRPVATALGIALDGRGWGEVSAAFDVVISTVPKGVADPLALDWAPPTVLFDALYDPWPTPLAAAAAGAGCAIVSGLELLLAQAELQFTLFTAAAAPTEAMRSALLTAAADR